MMEENFGKSLFFLGIGGVSMASIAILCQKEGYFVAGSDAKITQTTKALEKSGIKVTLENDMKAVENCDTVVYSLAIAKNHPQLQEAKKLVKNCCPRPRFLGQLLARFPHRIGVAGMHGKSTTTAMLAKICCDADTDPCVLCGAQVQDLGGRAYRISQKRELAIFEACEYRDAFLQLPATQALLLNVDYDHVDYFTSMQQICTSFYRFADGAQQVIANADDAYLSQALVPLRQKCITFGIGTRADYMAKNIKVTPHKGQFDLYYRNTHLCHITLPMGGEHNVKNALAAAACASENGISPETIAASLASFSGLCRRMEFVGILNGAPVYSDYAHHPTELRYALQTANEMAHARDGRLFCIFQSHTYSRTHVLQHDFARVLANADVLCLLPIFSARETNIYGVNEQELAQKANGRYFPSAQMLAQTLQSEVQENDTVLLVGAGDFDGLSNLI